MLAACERRIYNPTLDTRISRLGFPERLGIVLMKAQWVEGINNLWKIGAQSTTGTIIDWKRALAYALEHELLKLIRYISTLCVAFPFDAFDRASTAGKNRSLVQIKRCWADPPNTGIFMERAVMNGHTKTLILWRRWIDSRYWREIVQRHLPLLYNTAVENGGVKIMKLISRWVTDLRPPNCKIDYGLALKLSTIRGTRAVMRLIIPHCTNDDIALAIERTDYNNENESTIEFLRDALDKMESR